METKKKERVTERWVDKDRMTNHTDKIQTEEQRRRRKNKQTNKQTNLQLIKK